MVYHKIVEGLRCRYCGRTQRFAKTRKCVFCANWDAHERGDWRLIGELFQDWRVRQKGRANRHRRRAAKGTYTAEQARELLRWQDGCCAYCDESSDLHVDHAVPIVRGGTNWWWNLQWLCRMHNLQKHDMTDVEYRREYGIYFAHPPKRLLIYAATGLIVPFSGVLAT